ncbi:MAG: YraN family protein [Candidatus Eremiobacteraeota bacterium]|nr:YraN family protein [Candidatus Eremiobacteraeota bacterium]
MRRRPTLPPSRNTDRACTTVRHFGAYATRSCSSIFQRLRSTKNKGNLGEARAAAYLQECGFSILATNVRLPGGEIDLVCKDGDQIVFIEVKLRTTKTFGSALGGVHGRKRARLRRLAADYLQFFAPSARARFDIIAIDGDRIMLHRNAF